MTSVLGEKLREAIEKKSLATTIKQWDDEDNKQTLKDIPVIELKENTNTPTTTDSVREDCFKLVKDMPNDHTPMSLTRALIGRGHKESPTMQMVYAMVRRGVYQRNADGTLFTMHKTFREAMKATQPRNKAKQGNAGFSDAPAPKRKIVIINKRTGHTIETGGIAALKQEEQTTAPWNAGKFIEGLSVLQARELYLKLKEIFGG